MKVTNWRRKLAASLLAGGFLAPTAVSAQSLNTNLVNNPSFEMVDTGTIGSAYDAVLILNWTDGTQSGFAYNIAQAYDAGGPLAGGGEYYFTPNAQGVDVEGQTELDVTMPGQVSQNISVSTGTAATQIASGEAAVKLSAFFTSFEDDGDLGNLRVEFLNSASGSLGFAQITSKNPVTWHQVSAAAFVPVGTTTLRTSIFGTPISSGPDGYTDLVDVQITEAVNELLFLEVNTTTGQAAIKNQTGDPFHIDFYEIMAPAGGSAGDYNNNGAVDAADYVVWRNSLDQSVTLPNDTTPGMVTAADYDVWKANFGKSGGSNTLNATAWTSLQEQNLPGFPAGNGTGNGWEAVGGSDGDVLAEAFLEGNSLVANNASISLGAAFNVGSPQNLEFRYGVVADDGMGGFVGPGAFTRGFVRYVTSASASAVPEPSTALLVGAGLASLVVVNWRKP
jgi:hypothetical protein